MEDKMYRLLPLLRNEGYGDCGWEEGDDGDVLLTFSEPAAAQRFARERGGVPVSPPGTEDVRGVVIRAEQVDAILAAYE